MEDRNEKLAERILNEFSNEIDWDKFSKDIMIYGEAIIDIPDDKYNEIKNKYNMETINTISTLSNVIDSLNRADDPEALKIVIKKLLELVAKL